jgi:hypothetical protein
MDRKHLDFETNEPKKIRSDAYDGGKWETDPVLFRNRQWAVTEYGIENVAGPYHYYISKDQLPWTMGAEDRNWCHHMSEKTWVDDAAFDEVFEKAIEIHRVNS